MFAVVPPRRQSYPLEGDGALEGHLQGRLLYRVPVSLLHPIGAVVGVGLAEVALDLGDAVVSCEETLA